MKKLTGLIIANIFILAGISLFMSNFFNDCEYEEINKPIGKINFIYYGKEAVIGTDLGYKFITTGRLYQQGDSASIKLRIGNCEDRTEICTRNGCEEI